MLNETINIDLHIHSKVSEYKEEKKIVEHSTFSNIEVLLAKLDSDEHAISMFSFTDHNRFDSELYINTRDYINKRTNNHLKTLLAGVEFDVLLEKDKRPCHVLTIFNAQTNEELKKIETEITNKKLDSKDAYYSRKEFENIILEIKLETILIVCQRKDMSNDNGKHTSLSDSTSYPFEYLKFGYFNGLEYQKPTVEGILRDNLLDIDRELGLILGSDCHEWEFYPKHSEKAEEKDAYSSEIKSLPSFKGLLLTLTSPSTRFRRKQNQKSNYIKKLHINSKTYEISPGINAIIGENGSGKSLLIDVLTKEDKKIESYYKKIVADNSLKFDKKALVKTQIVRQSEIIKNKYRNKLFDDGDSLYKHVDDSSYLTHLKTYSNQLSKQILKRIEFTSCLNKIKTIKHTYDESKLGTTFFINITKEDKFEEIANPHQERRDNLNSVLAILENELRNDYYNETSKKHLTNAINEVRTVINVTTNEYEKVVLEKKIKNIIVSKINEYNLNINKLTTADDAGKVVYQNERDKLVNGVVSAIKLTKDVTEHPKPNFPKDVNGYEENPVRGFVFKRVAKYHRVDFESKFYEFMFNSKYKCYSDLSAVVTEQDLASAIKNAGSTISKINSQWLVNYEKFVKEVTQKDEYILDSSDNNSEIGNTLGEMSLVYYKYKTYNSSDWDILVVDQPEDNISNPKIKEALIEYLNSLRDDKQIIFVTHNPLLVVNLDVDNLIYVEKINNDLSIISGCLEDEDNKILDLVAEKMDGGVETIEKRLKYYGKNY